MTARDRMVLSVVVALVVFAAAWFVLLAPGRKDAKALDVQISEATTRLAASKVTVAAGESAQAGYKTDYATVARLGKAVPSDDDLPSLVYQLQNASARSRVDFRSIELAGQSGAAAPVTPAAQVAAVGAAEKGQPAATGTTGATGTSGASGATQAATSTLPPDTVIGAAGLPTMPFDFAFNGSFFRIQDLLHRLDRFTQVEGKKVSVRGRLVSIDGFSLKASGKGFPDMRASLHATAFVLPDDAAAPPSAAPGTAGLTTQPVSGSSPTIPTPTAAATGVGTR